VELGCLSNESWLSEASKESSCDHGYNESRHVERAEANDQQITSLGKELWVHEHRLSTLASHVECSNDVLPLGLTSVLLGRMEEFSHKSAIGCSHFFLSGELSRELLVLHLRLHLILGVLKSKLGLRLVLNSLSALLLLSGYALLIAVSSHLTHLLLLLKSLLISLKFELNLVLGSPLRHLCFILSGLSLLLLLDLGSLNLELLGILSNLKLLGSLLLHSKIESILRVRAGVQIFGSL